MAHGGMSSGTWIDSAQPERALDSFNSARSNVPQPQTDCYLQCVHVVWIVVHLVWLAALCSIALMNSRYYSKSIRKYFCVTKPDNDRNNIFFFWIDQPKYIAYSVYALKATWVKIWKIRSSIRIQMVWKIRNFDCTSPMMWEEWGFGGYTYSEPQRNSTTVN